MINDNCDVNVKLTNVIWHRHKYYNGPSNESEHLDKNQRIGLGHERCTSMNELWGYITLHLLHVTTMLHYTKNILSYKTR